MTHEENRAPAILASTGTVAEEGEEDSDDEILNNPDKFRDESLGTLPAVRVRQDDIFRGGIDPSIPLKPSRGTGSRITPLYTPLEVKIAPLCLNYCFCACKSASNAHKLLT